MSEEGYTKKPFRSTETPEGAVAKQKKASLSSPKGIKRASALLIPLDFLAIPIPK